MGPPGRNAERTASRSSESPSAPSCTSRKAPLGWLSAPESSFQREAAAGARTASPLRPVRAAAEASTECAEFRPCLLGPVLLENGTEDEKASAGDHRHGVHPSFALRRRVVVRVVIVHQAIPMSVSRSASLFEIQRGEPLSLGLFNVIVICPSGRVEILTESLILAQDERWRRA